MRADLAPAANLVEIFSSVQGEGPHLGQSTLFVRFAPTFNVSLDPMVASRFTPTSHFWFLPTDSVSFTSIRSVRQLCTTSVWSCSMVLFMSYWPWTRISSLPGVSSIASSLYPSPLYVLVFSPQTTFLSGSPNGGMFSA